MKKSIYILSIAALVFAAAGCKGFLDEAPKSVRSSATAYSDDKSFEMGVLGVYDCYNDLYIDVSTPFLGELGTDETIATFQQYNILPLYYYTVTANDLNVMPNWYGYHYRTIANANVLIEAAEGQAESGELSAGKKRAMAEAKALRAWCYFRLVQSLGPVALVTKEMKAPDATLARESVGAVYGQILQDLKDASDEVILPTARDVSFPGRLTHWAVRAMLGKVYLTMASTKETGEVDKLLAALGKTDLGYNSSVSESVSGLYASARTVLDDIVTNSGIQLAEDFRQLFTAQHKNSFPENMWELQAGDGVTASVPDRGFYFLFRYGMSNGANLSPVLNGIWRKDVVYNAAMFVRTEGGYQEEDARKHWNLMGGLKGTSGAGAGVYQYLQAFWQPANNAYSIQNQTLAVQEAGWTTHSMFYTSITKFRFFDASKELHEQTTYVDNRSLPLNFTVIRYADVLLMLAEAELKCNGMAVNQKVIDCLNPIRDRAREAGAKALETIPVFTLASEIPMDTILNERKLELAFELVRWFDLARTGTLYERYNQTIPTGNQSHQTLAEDGNGLKKYYLYPIPYKEINTSTNPQGFFQNYGY